MGIIAQNKISSLGMLFGTIALIMGIIHFSFGPFILCAAANAGKRRCGKNG
ncbi:hypothetical protein EA14781_087_00180 [Escherichia albertii NBRC 107761 = DSM 17582]|nr:hypothetical protein EA14781_087_00180 [Escherichia albertii NBRC 107761 = DSM 17582]